MNEISLNPPNPYPGQVVNLTLGIVNKNAIIKNLVVTLGAEQKKPPKGLFSQEKGPDTTIVPLGVSSRAQEIPKITGFLK